MKLTEADILRINKIYNQVTGANHPKKRPSNMYPDDAIFMIELIIAMKKELEKDEADGGT